MEEFVAKFCSSSRKMSRSDLQQMQEHLMQLLLQQMSEQMLVHRRRMQEKFRRRQRLAEAMFQQQLMETENLFMRILPQFVRHLERRGRSGRRAKAQQIQRLRQPKMPTFSFYQNLIKNFSDQQWRSRFRMSKQTYDWLCSQLGGRIQQQAGVHSAVNMVDVPKRIAIALYALASGDDYRDIAILFDITRNTVSHMVQRFSEAFLEMMGDHLVAMPAHAEEYNAIRHGFHQATNMPAIMVAVLGHLKLPIFNALQEMNAIKETATQSFTLETLVDNCLLFRKVLMHRNQSQLLWHCPNEITQLQSLHAVGDRQLPSVVLSPRLHYPLTDWLLHQYDEPDAPHEFDFNEAAENMLAFNDQAYLRLFGRWKILAYKHQFDYATMSSLVQTCCALHNLVEQLEEPFDEQWTQNLDMSRFQITIQDLVVPPSAPSLSALEMRDFLARTISSTEM